LVITTNTVKDVIKDIETRHRFKEYITDKSGCKTIEIVNASFVADKPYLLREPSKEYIARELEWYKSQSLSVHDMPGGVPEIWVKVSDKNGFINSNYGWCIWSEDNTSQYDNVLIELGENPDSRRANMIYTRPEMWHDYCYNGMSDFMCTNNVQYFIRNNHLVTCVYMRSNDAVFGYNNDYAWQEYVRDKLILDLETDTGNVYEKGPIYWNVGSLHVYERHFDLINEQVGY
tara:strand:- start:1181 stop:1873 length:693 start_codon:yes stop_codon:yes gene_type:complete